MLKNIHFLFISFVFICLVFCKPLYAVNWFSDEFSFMDSTKWNYNLNGGLINFTNGLMTLSSTYHRFPYISNSAGTYAIDRNVIFEFKFNYQSSSYMGNGFGVGFTGTDGYPYYQFSIWNDLVAGPVFQYQNFIESASGVCNRTPDDLGLQKFLLREKISNNSWHVFKVEKRNKAYVVYLDSEIIYVTPNNQCTPLNIFIGNPLTGGLSSWNVLVMDYFREYTGTYTKNKIIILPGLGASWNPEAILVGSTATSYQWTMTPFVKNYDSLINALIANGLIKGQDFYVWNYDWRKPLSDIVSDFNSYVSTLSLESGQGIDLVGHSLGGLVARTWAQDHGASVGQVISLGSPHYGSVKAYEAWNAAKVSDTFDAASIALNVLLQLQKKNNNTAVETIRSYAPILFDLSPTFDFLKKNGVVTTAKKSQYLVDKNNVVTNIKDILTTVDGVGVTTKEWINLSDRSWFDQLLGIWEDGRPVSYLYGEGDGTVLKKSALISSATNYEFSSNHGELVDKSTNWILEKLGLATTVLTASSYPSKQAVFYLGSPATMIVNCGGTQRSENSGWIVVENQESKNCTVNLTGKDSGGTYHLVSGEGEEWNYFEGEISVGDTKQVVLSSADSYWQILRRDLVNVGATTVVVEVDKKNILTTIDAYINYLANKKNYGLSESIIKNLKIILSKKGVTPLETKNAYLKAVSSKLLVDTNLRLMLRKNLSPKYSSAFIYYQGINLMGGSNDYAGNYLANKLFGIVWK